jgi:hypothetical protein
MHPILRIAFFVALAKMYFALGCPPLMPIGMWRVEP